jgi:hypothetical protein
MSQSSPGGLGLGLRAQGLGFRYRKEAEPHEPVFARRFYFGHLPDYFDQALYRVGVECLYRV